MKNQLNFLVGICCLLLPSLGMAVTHNVDVGDNFFSPANLTIEVGDTVHWVGVGNRSHNARANDGSFASNTSSSLNFFHTFIIHFGFSLSHVL